MSFPILTVLLGCAIVLAQALPAPNPKEVLDSKGDKAPTLDTIKDQKADEKFSIANWVSPPEVVKNFPYYLSGYDHEDRPIVVIDIGKWDARSWHKKGKEDWANLEHHAEKMLDILRSGILAKNFTDENNVTKPVTDEMGLIVDFDGFNVAQMTSPHVLAFMTKYLGQLETIQEKLAYAYFVNVNAVASVVVRLLRPVMGKAMERVEIYGTKPSQWMPILRRNLPGDQIPKKYGGEQGHNSLVNYG
ncbi:unnamed protein product [Allacma fusca]|uniref:CRAL-TRIO domain-containing protein n=1 Tax=Allacma fusca TaxID=39272 RepID=A0A8J2LKJ5_9HEXA|nr:unnamed protein product [Allacma fusca]